MTQATAPRQDWISFAFTFLVPIAFFWLFREYGAKPAIASAVILTVVQVSVLLALRRKISPFFVVAAGFTVVFGSLDLWVADPRFFRFEPAFQSGLIGVIFGLSLWIDLPVIRWFGEALPKSIRPDFARAGEEAYLRKVTMIWVIYLLVKAVLYGFVAVRIDLGQLILFRAVVGTGSVVLLFAGEIAYRKWIRGERLRNY